MARRRRRRDDDDDETTRRRQRPKITYQSVKYVINTTTTQRIGRREGGVVGGVGWVDGGAIGRRREKKFRRILVMIFFLGVLPRRFANLDCFCLFARRKNDSLPSRPLQYFRVTLSVRLSVPPFFNFPRPLRLKTTHRAHVCVANCARYTLVVKRRGGVRAHVRCRR
jgi:hypothetical protein